MNVVIQCEEGFRLIKDYLETELDSYEHLVGSIIIYKDIGKLRIYNVRAYGKTIRIIYYSLFSFPNTKNYLHLYEMFSQGMLQSIEIDEEKLFCLTMWCAFKNVDFEKNNYFNQLFSNGMVEKFSEKIISFINENYHDLTNWPKMMYPIFYESSIFSRLYYEVQALILEYFSFHHPTYPDLSIRWRDLLSVNLKASSRIPDNFKAHPSIFYLLPIDEKYNILNDKLKSGLKIDFAKRYSMLELNDKDLELCKTWFDSYDKEYVNNSVLEFKDRILRFEGLGNNFFLGKLLSARMAEKVVITFLTEAGYSCEDVSLLQVTNPNTTNWKLFDIKAGDRYFDVKNTRRSNNKKDVYSEVYVPKLKETKGGLCIEIIGTLSPYRRPKNLLDHREYIFKKEELPYVEVLGVISANQLSSIKKQFSIKNFFEIDLVRNFRSHCGNQKNKNKFFIPPWCFDTKELYQPNPLNIQLMNIYFSELGSFIDFPGINAIALCLSFGKNPMFYNLPLENWQEMFINKVLSWKNSNVPTLPYIYLSIMSHFLDMAKHKDKHPSFSPEKYKEMVFLSSNQKMPLFTFDPLSTVSSLIDAFSKIWDWDMETHFFEGFSFFNLRSSYVLRGNHTRLQKEVTILAYCGGWLPENKPCDVNPLVLGVNMVCEDCGKLICNKCGFCKKGCGLNSDKQEGFSTMSKENCIS